MPDPYVINVPTVPVLAPDVAAQRWADVAEVIRDAVPGVPLMCGDASYSYAADLDSLCPDKPGTVFVHDIGLIWIPDGGDELPQFILMWQWIKMIHPVAPHTYTFYYVDPVTVGDKTIRVLLAFEDSRTSQAIVTEIYRRTADGASAHLAQLAPELHADILLETIRRIGISQVAWWLDAEEIAFDAGSARAEVVRDRPRHIDPHGFIVLTNRRLIYVDDHSEVNGHVGVSWSDIHKIKKSAMRFESGTSGFRLQLNDGRHFEFSASTEYVREILKLQKAVRRDGTIAVPMMNSAVAWSRMFADEADVEARAILRSASVPGA